MIGTILVLVLSFLLIYKYTNLLNVLKSNESLIIDVISDNEKAVVQVIKYEASTSTGLGSGVVYKKDDHIYYVVTNVHVIVNADELKVQLYDETILIASVLKIDTENDLAIITITTNKNLPVVKASKNNLQKGQSVISIGTPLNVTYFNTATTGIISNLNKNLIQHSSPVNPGNSGGALFNLKGELIGINTSKVITSHSNNELINVEGISIATNVSLVKELFK